MLQYNIKSGDFDDTYTIDPCINIGTFSFTPHDPSHTIYKRPEDVPDCFIAIEFETEHMPWLLDEKSELFNFESPKWWNIYGRLREFLSQKVFQKNYIRELTEDMVQRLTATGLKFRIMSRGESKSYCKQWIYTFGLPAASKKKLRKIALTRRDYPWHIFSYELVKSPGADLAREYFNAAKKEGCALYLNFIDQGFEIANGESLTADFIDIGEDILITSADFTWTYVQTHEEYCGPYYAAIEPK
jgi:hypothetical protein